MIEKQFVYEICMKILEFDRMHTNENIYFLFFK
jgi:hypothetical protein